MCRSATPLDWTQNQLCPADGHLGFISCCFVHIDWLRISSVFGLAAAATAPVSMKLLSIEEHKQKKTW